MKETTMADIAWFTDADATDKSLVGGKGANLGLLAQAAFPVPPGFCVTTAAYASFLERARLRDWLNELAGALDYEDPDALEMATAAMREIIVAAPMPAGLAGALDEAYTKLGAGSFVAVRSSATAEDLAEASFAGLHDSFLDVCGSGALVDAVQRCWASMWTARATAYRHKNGFDHRAVSISVVVQQMVEAEASGVVFTGNPITTATDELVINAGYGLGEAIVQGIVTPDEYTVKTGTLTIAARTRGGKALRTVRNPETGTGTVTEDVPEPLRHAYALNDDQIAELAALARRVQSHYGEVPQDIEWAAAGGRIHLLQSRPITGVEFSWDADVDEWQASPDDDGIVWTRTWADMAWTGAISPLFYSIRGDTWTRFGMNHALNLLGAKEDAKAVTATRTWKFHKAEAYYNTAVEQALVEKLTAPAFRESRLWPLNPTSNDAVKAAPFSKVNYLLAQLRLYAANPQQSLTGWFKPFFDRIYDPASIKTAEGLSNDELAKLSDRELVKYIERMIDIEVTYYEDGYLGFVFHVVDAYNVLGWMIANWYDGENPMAYFDLITGSNKRTETQIQNRRLWEISEEIRKSAALIALMKEHQGRDFFARLADSEEGRAVLARYEAFAAEYPHRGHDDRDIAYTRREEDPHVDYQALQSLLSGSESVDPAVQEDEVNARRQATYEEVVANIRKKALGALKAEAVKLTYEYLHKFIPARDDERDYADRYLYAWRKAYLELGRRLVDRGLFETADDVFYLARPELYRLFEGNTTNLPLTKAKIAARRRDFQRFYNRQAKLPLYLSNNRPVQFGVTQDVEAGVFQGSPTSRGTTKGTARVVKRLKDIGTVNAGEILICNSTDPGWTPVFLIIAGIVTETGGIMSHAACLSREYGFPSVQLEDAMQLIPDGASISVDGDTGIVRLVK
jgi:rifampicin phosphotransferase